MPLVKVNNANMIFEYLQILKYQLQNNFKFNLIAKQIKRLLIFKNKYL